MRLNELGNRNFDLLPVALDYNERFKIVHSPLKAFSDTRASGFTVVERGHIERVSPTTDINGGTKWRHIPSKTRYFLVGDTGIEPVTSSVSGKRATAAPIAHI